LPIVIQTPEGGVIGPGLQVAVTTNQIGPIPPDSILAIDVFQQAGEDRCSSWNFPITGPISFPVLDLEHASAGPFRATVHDGQPVTLKTTITSPIGIFDEGTTTGLTWSTTGQLPELLKELTTSTSTGGFTETDRANLTTTLEAVQVPFPISSVAGGIAQTALGKLIQQVPLGLMQKQDCVNITGDGVLTRPGGAFNVNALGLTWQFVVVPEFMGKLTGALNEYEQRVVQLKLITRSLNGADEVLDLIDAHSDQQYTTWGLNALDRIEYSVTPGCEVQICWLLLL
jgi:hypothetical protein